MGHRRGSDVVPLYSTGIISYVFLIVSKVVSCTVSEIQPTTCPAQLYLAKPLAFNPRWKGSLVTISIKSCMGVSRWLGYKMAQKHCKTFQPAEQGAVTIRYRQTDNRRICNDRYLNITQSCSDKNRMVVSRYILMLIHTIKISFCVTLFVVSVTVTYFLYTTSLYQPAVVFLSFIYQ